MVGFDTRATNGSSSSSSSGSERRGVDLDQLALVGVPDKGDVMDAIRTIKLQLWVCYSSGSVSSVILCVYV